MRFALITAWFFAVNITPVWAAQFEFDLTNLLGDSFPNAITEAEVDLGIEFNSITSAEFNVDGDFSPGTMRAVGPPPNTNPLVPTDTVSLTLKVGEVGTAFFEKELFASQTMEGLEGDVQLNLTLLETATDVLHVLLPTANSTTSFDSLLDGKFGLSAGTSHWVASLYQVIGQPTLELTRITLRIEGTSVPEPSTIILLSTSAAMAVAVRAR